MNTATPSTTIHADRKLYITKACKTDIDRIMVILGEARIQMGRMGIDQWQYGYPNRDIIKEDVIAGRSFAVRTEEKGEIYATFCLKTDGEPTYREIFDGAWITRGSYGALHRIAVCNAERGSGMADAMVAFALEECRRLGLGALRSDTHAGNRPMQKLLFRTGFTRCGIIYLKTGEERVAFEKAVETEASV